MSALLEEGDLVDLTPEHVVYADVPKHFVYGNRKGDFALTHAEARLREEAFGYLCGRYVVVRTATNGGGHNFDGDFPDGHHVYCESIDRKYHVDFYQTGCFTAMNPGLRRVGRAALRWVVEELPA